MISWKAACWPGIGFYVDLCNKSLYSQSYDFSSSHVWMWELDHKEGWEPKKWCFWTMRLENTLESPLDCKEIKPVNPEENHYWIFIGRTDAEAEALILRSCDAYDAKSWLIRKDPDAEQDWRQGEKGTTKEKMIGWHHQLPELVQTHVHWVCDDIQTSHPLLSPSPPAFNLAQHQGLFQ